jgi:multimeric flavodoxin WrbA
MKITTVLGSPRRQGNTAAVLGLFEELAVPRYELRRINVVDFNIHGCCGCDACQQVLDEPGCIEEDDLVGVLETLMDSDLIIYASPVYVWSFPAAMKAFMDRHYCTVKWEDGEKVASLLEGKRAALLVTCGGSEEANADLIRLEFQREMDYLGMRHEGTYVVANCSTPVETVETHKGLEVAQRMARELL